MGGRNYLILLRTTYAWQRRLVDYEADAGEISAERRRGWIRRQGGMRRGRHGQGEDSGTGNCVNRPQAAPGGPRPQRPSNEGSVTT